MRPDEFPFCEQSGHDLAGRGEHILRHAEPFEQEFASANDHHRNQDDDQDLEFGAMITEAERRAGEADAIAAATFLLVEFRDLVAQRLVHSRSSFEHSFSFR